MIKASALRDFVLAGAVFAGAGGCDRMLTRPSMYTELEVVTTDQAGAPVAGVSLELYTGPRPMMYAFSDSTGRHVFRDVPRAAYGVVAVAPRGYTVENHIEGNPKAAVIDTLDLLKGDVAPVQFRFVGPGGAAVRVHAQDGTPLVGVTVQLYTWQSIFSETKTDSTGVARFGDVTVGTGFGVQVLRPIYYRDFVRERDSVVKTRDGLYLSAPGDTVDVDMPLARCSGTLVSTTLDQDGRPVANVKNEFYTWLESLGTVVSDANGRAAHALPCAFQSAVRIAPPGGYTVRKGAGSSYIEGFTPSNGDSLSVTFRVERTR